MPSYRLNSSSEITTLEREILFQLRRLNKNELDEAMTQLRKMRKEGVA